MPTYVVCIIGTLEYLIILCFKNKCIAHYNKTQEIQFLYLKSSQFENSKCIIHVSGLLNCFYANENLNFPAPNHRYFYSYLMTLKKVNKFDNFWMAKIREFDNFCIILLLLNTINYRVFHLWLYENKRSLGHQKCTYNS